MTEEWRYGTIVRRAITKNPPTYQYLMYIGPGRFGTAPNPSVFTGVRLTDFIHTIGPPEVMGYINERFQRDLFEIAPEFADE